MVSSLSLVKHDSNALWVNVWFLIFSQQLNNQRQIVFLSREDLNQMMTLEKSLCAEIDVAEKTVALTEDKCAAMKQRLPEMMELEKTEKGRVTYIGHI